MSKNLSIKLSHPSAPLAMIKYARIDNNNNPTYIIRTPNATVSPAVTTITVAENLPNGQYKIIATPMYLDGRPCDSETIITTPCEGLISLNAYIDDNILYLSWEAPDDVPQTRITINYPNGGQEIKTYVNTSPSMTANTAVPPGNIGTFTISGQSICDPVSGFYSAPSSSVSISNDTTPETGSYLVLIENNSTTLTITSILGIPGMTISNVLPETSRIGTRSTSGSTSSIHVYFDDEAAAGKSMELFINGISYQCVDFASSPANFVIPFGLAGSEDIKIEINDTTC